MPRQSAGLLVYHFFKEVPKVLLVHPGGPFFAKKDAGVWSVPKGEFEEGEDPKAVALREFEEETGNRVEATDFIQLTPIRTKSGKRVYAWAAASYFDKAFVCSNLFEMEWPPKSGKKAQFYETDNAAWFGYEEALVKINPGQVPLLHELFALLGHKDQSVCE